MATPTATDHSADSTHQKPRYDDINVPVVVMWGFISAILTLATFLFLSGVYNVWHDYYIQQRQDSLIDRSREQVEQQKERLIGFNGSKPIADAKAEIVNQFKPKTADH